jgi:hypothetical protein
MAVVSTYISAGDLPTAPNGAGAGPLAGLNNFYGYYLYANVTEVFDTDLNRSTYSGPSMIADLFFDPEASSYDSHTFATCGLKWSSPTEYVLNSVVKLTAFRCQPSRASLMRRDRSSLMRRDRSSPVRRDRSSPVRRDRASPAKQGERQEYIDVLSLHRQSLQKSSASTTYMHTCLLRATGYEPGTAS